MPRVIKPLTAVQVKNAKPQDKPYKLYDGGGLFLLVTPAGGKLWRLKYRQENGKEGLLSFGSYPAVSLEQARRKRDEAKQQKASGNDPGQIARAEKAESKSLARNTFAAIAGQWIDFMGSKIAPQTLKYYNSLMKNYLLPNFGDMPVKKIKPSHLIEVFRKIEEKGTLYSSKRSCQICSNVMQYAVALELIEINPVPSIRKLLKVPKYGHFSAVIDPESLGNILYKIEQYKGYGTIRNALRMMPYVFVRSSELMNARWADMNFDACEWRYTVRKTNTPHIVPLAPQVIGILNEQRNISGDCELVFPGYYDKTKRMGPGSMCHALRTLGIPYSDMTVHGFRATARTLLDEVLGERYEYIEHQLAHAVRDPNGRAYNRTEHLAERKRMMIRWATYLDTLREKARQAA
ncbi:integrase arm-type DNA-binding domain-containing protein [Desulfovibrio sp. ZJ200]|uniref:tyrosine-type recombinase/integrase n=1 Tax=Desulfovibrio sp. ZJ200 TaxID=2709792 RepID=UPI0013ECFFA0|nr:integrase arm-type DNA-binding domain-containing protein [Desulfovibrio sp. ZJ200]